MEVIVFTTGLMLTMIIIPMIIISIKRKIFDNPEPLPFPEIEAKWSKAQVELDWAAEVEALRKAKIDAIASIFASVITVTAKAVVLTVADSILGAIAQGLRNDEKTSSGEIA
jgi:hypothetical protein